MVAYHTIKWGGERAAIKGHGEKLKEFFRIALKLGGAKPKSPAIGQTAPVFVAIFDIFSRDEVKGPLRQWAACSRGRLPRDLPGQPVPIAAGVRTRRVLRAELLRH